MAKHLHESHDGEPFDMFDELHAGVAHRVTADADEMKGGVARPKLSGNSGRMEIAGRLAGDEEDLTHWR